MKELLESLKKIPEGKVTTYRILADKFNIHPRAVASVLKSNKHPEIYPCYKVVHHNGRIGGYSCEGGIKKKIALLERDGIGVWNGRVNPKHLYTFSVFSSCGQ